MLRCSLGAAHQQWTRRAAALQCWSYKRRFFSAVAQSPEGSGKHADALQIAYVSLIDKGRLERDEVQMKALKMLSDTLEKLEVTRGKPNDEVAEEAAGPEARWVWLETRSSLGAAAVAADHKRAQEYTARLAAENAKRVKSQAKRARSGVPRDSSKAADSKASTTEAASPSKPEATGNRPDTSKAIASKKVQPAARKRPEERLSIYLYGPVGTGKTMLLNLFHQQAQEAGMRVLRRHFYEFMLELHGRIHDTKEDRPVERVANTLADQIEALCFDEFQITDLQDAVIVPRLFEVLFLRGVSVVLTSNTKPQLLYTGGLNRHVHLPHFISLLGDHCNVVSLGAAPDRPAIDYRRRAEEEEFRSLKSGGSSGAYFVGDEGQELLSRCWQAMTVAVPEAPQELALTMGRHFSVEQSAGDACLLNFSELCCGDHGEADFLAIAARYGVVLLQGVEDFPSLEASDRVRRFVKLLDVFYDSRVALVLSASVPLDSLFTGIREDVMRDDMGDLAWRTALYSSDGKAGMSPSAVATLCEAIQATDRAESRLREMRTLRYIQACSEAPPRQGAAESLVRTVLHWLQSPGS